MPKKRNQLCLLLSLAALFSPFLWAERFEWHNLPGTGAGYDMTVASFAYLSLHDSIQAANINADGLMDIVVLADGGLPQVNDFISVGGYIDSGHYLFGWGGAGRESPNVRAGVRGDHNGRVYAGSDLAWFRNDGFGYFFPIPIWVGPAPPTISHGKTMEVFDLDADNDDDIVVWCSSGLTPQDNVTLGAGKVTWFENLRFPSGAAEPQFVQHDVVVGTFTVGPVTYNAGSPRGGTLADVDGDGRRDLVVLNYSAAALPGGQSGFYWFKNMGPGAGMFTTANVSAIQVSGVLYGDPFAIGVTVRDLDNDGDMDFVLGENGAGLADREVIFLQNAGPPATPAFTRTTILNNFLVSQSLAVSDLIPGGCQEIVAGGRGPAPERSPLSVFSNNALNCGGVWTRTSLPGADLGEFVWDVRVAQMNNDPGNRLDVVAFYTDDNTGASAGLPAGRFSAVTMWANDSNAVDAWRAVPLPEDRDLPSMTVRPGGGLAVWDFDNDGDEDVIRSHVGAPLAYFENTWNTERHFQVQKTATRGNLIQKITSFFSTQPNRSLGPLVGQEVESR